MLLEKMDYYFKIDELVKSPVTCHCEERSDEAIS